MAVAKAVVTLTDDRNSFVAGNKYFTLGIVAIDASPATYAAGGIPVTFPSLVKASRAPQGALVQGLASGTTGTLFVYRYIPGADAASGKLKIFTGGAGSTAGLAEFTDTGAIPADVSTDLIAIACIFFGQL